ncbi:acyltransferase [Mucilaginibacter aquatilis]|uniref:Acyltransferase n=1 Tax=Mucilaginibacter aquatilis TaxID=1517760 RepID=A0A6I4IC27_9SPHI|nr:acyltransferase [Mucilaginibacter aquatilis]MVN92771.1 acyltransferase [Mucilaginibacter aquatilis]
MFLKLIALILPWSLKRRALQKWFGYNIHPSAKVGLAWAFPRSMTMKAGSRIDHFTTAVHLDYIELGQNATIGRSNWITGFSTYDTQTKHFKHQQNRKAELILGEEAAITKNHHIDCTSAIHIGRFSTIAGYNSQLLTHSIDVFENRQDSSPITIGDYCFVGTNVVVLGGSVLPSHSVLGAKSLLSKTFSDTWTLYAGVPAKAIKIIPQTAKYFTRTEGFVH